MSANPRDRRTGRTVCFDDARIRRSPEIGLVPQLVSEVVAAIPYVMLVGLWEHTSNGEYVLRKVSWGRDRYREILPQLNENCRRKIGLKVGIHGTSAEVGSLISGLDLNRWTRLRGSKRASRETFDPLWGILLKVNTSAGNFLVEIYARRKPTTVPAGPLVKQIKRFCAEYLAGTQLLMTAEEAFPESDSRFRHQLGPLPHGRVWSLPMIQDALFLRLRTRIGDDVLKEMHLFLLDPDDHMLYYVAPDHLGLDETVLAATSDPWRLPELSGARERMEYVKTKLAGIERETSTKGLIDCYDKIIHEGLAKSTIRNHVDILRTLLRGLPQELDEGVAGEAVRTGVMAIGGDSDREEPRWDVGTLEARGSFFAQKLALEKLFGVAEHGYLVAMPIYDGAQIVGSVFMVTSKEPGITEKIGLLETAYEASNLITQYRDTTFLRSVIDAVSSNTELPLSWVVGERFGNILMHEVLLVAQPGPNGIDEFTSGWWMPPNRFRRTPVPQAVLRSNTLREVFDAAVRGDGVVEIPKHELDNEAIGMYADDWHTALLVPFVGDTRFLAILKESADQVYLSADRIQQVFAIIQTLARLPETFRRAAEIEDLRQRGIFSAHGLGNRYSIPLISICCDLEELAEHPSVSADVRNRIEETREEIEFLGKMMKKQLSVIEARLPGFESTGQSAPIDLTALLKDDSHRFFQTTVRAKDESWSQRHYSRTVQLDTQGVMDNLQVWGELDEVQVAFWDILENTLKDYSVSQNIVVNHPQRSLIRITAEASNGDVNIHIIDRGEGISPEMQEMLNERFRRISTGAHVAIDGTAGIGLYNAPLTFARVTGERGERRGRMWVSHNSDVGTTFRICLPQYIPSATGPDGMQTSLPKQQRAAVQVPPTHVTLSENKP